MSTSAPTSTSESSSSPSPRLPMRPLANSANNRSGRVPAGLQSDESMEEYKRKPVSDEMRHLIIKKHLAGFSLQKIHEHTSRKYTTVANIVYTWERTGQIRNKPRGGKRRQGVLKDHHKQWLRRFFDTHPGRRTLETARDGLLEAFPEDLPSGISIATVRRAIKEQTPPTKRPRANTGKRIV